MTYFLSGLFHCIVCMYMFMTVYDMFITFVKQYTFLPQDGQVDCYYKPTYSLLILEYLHTSVMEVLISHFNISA